MARLGIVIEEAEETYSGWSSWLTVASFLNREWRVLSEVSELVYFRRIAQDRDKEKRRNRSIARNSIVRFVNHSITRSFN